MQNANIKDAISTITYDSAMNPDGLPQSPACGGSQCEALILCTQARVSECESQLFCSAAERLACELEKARNLCELRQIIDMAACLLTASATKEHSLADIIKATHKKNTGSGC